MDMPNLRVDVFDASMSRPVSPSEVEKCRSLVSAIDASTNSEGELNWRDPNNRPVHDLTGIDWRSIDAELLNNLRPKSYIFSGWHLANFGRSEKVPCWTDAIAEHFPGHEPWEIAAFRHYARGLPNDYICRPPLVCGEAGFRADGVCVNPDTVSYQERMAILFRAGLLEGLKQSDNPTILEIGAGYGALALFIKRVIPQARYVIVDLPSSLKFSGCYLTIAQSRWPVEVVGAARDGISLVPSDALDRLDFPIDFAINTLSFQEMPAAVVRGYGQWIARNLTKHGVLFEQNFDNSHFQIATFCDPSAALRPYFRKPQIIEGRYHWGTPRLWRKRRWFSQWTQPHE